MNILFTLNQDKVFLHMIVVGIILGFVYDLFKSKRMLLGSGDFILFIDDLLFCFICCAVFIAASFIYNYGIIRWYLLAAVAFGFIIFRLTLSRPFMYVMSILAILILPIKLIMKRIALRHEKLRSMLFRHIQKQRIIHCIKNLHMTRK